MLDGYVRYNEMIGPDRDDILQRRMMDDAIALYDMGLKPAMVRQFLGTLDYVQVYFTIPKRFEQVEALPKGAKWSTAEKIEVFFDEQKKTFRFLPFDGDLYIKPYTIMAFPPDTKAGKAQTIVIRGYESLTAEEVLYGEPLPPMPDGEGDPAKFNSISHGYVKAMPIPNASIAEGIVMYWNKHGMRIWPGSILRDV